MKRFALKKIVMALVAACSIASCGGGEEQNSPEEKKGNEQTPKILPTGETTSVKSEHKRKNPAIGESALASFVEGQYDLNFELLKAAEEQIEGQNAMISTFSIQMALGMTWGGAAGNTADEMKNVLHFGSNTHDALNKLEALVMSKNEPADNSEYNKHDAVEIKSSNNLYFSTKKYTWATAWLDLLAENYGAGLEEIDFAADPEKARKYINSVVEKDTNSRIKNLIPEKGITAATMSVITNALFFKAPWDDEIKKDGHISFNNLDGNKKELDKLYASNNFKYMKGDSFAAVSLPLYNKSFEVLFVVPDAGSFSTIANKLNGSLVSNIFSSLSNKKEVYVELPPFTFDTSLSLSAPLKSLGMVEAFDMTGKANFSLMTKEKNLLYIDEIYHKTFVGLDEKGVEAAAATAVVSNEGAIDGETDEPEIISIIIDRPFFFAIYEKESKTPLFVGRVLNPAE